MFSGGLDSILAARIIRDEGFEVVALHFYTGFNGAVSGDTTRHFTVKPVEHSCIEPLMIC